MDLRLKKIFFFFYFFSDLQTEAYKSEHAFQVIFASYLNSW